MIPTKYDKICSEIKAFQDEYQLDFAGEAWLSARTNTSYNEWMRTAAGVDIERCDKYILKPATQPKEAACLKR